MSYATLADVLSRAGLVRGTFVEGADVGPAEIELFLAQVAGEIDGIIAARGFVTPLAEPSATAALVGVNADGALLLALASRFPGRSGGEAVAELRAAVQGRYSDAWTSLSIGTHSAILILEGASDAPGASNFWDTEPDDGMIGSQSWREAWSNPTLLPTHARGEKF